MKKLLIVVTVLIVVGIGAYYLVSQNGSSGIPTYTPAVTSNPTTQTPAPTTSMIVPTFTPTPKVSSQPKVPMSPTPAPSNATVRISNFAFNPSTLTIKSGTKVTWVNNDSVSHTVTSDTGNLLNSPALAPGQSFSFTFVNSGSVNYHCAIHPMMMGSIVITN